MKHRLPLYLFIILLVGCNAETDCGQVLHDKCLSCHGSATTCTKLGASKRQWLQTIDAMITLKADVSPQERSTLASCLTQTDSPGLRRFCGSD
ncbi:MAG: hypothetical protein Q4G66_12475 [bacterium]|nr:hypothetical protein [bacterium]